MDRYQAEMIARGPALAGDGGTPAGSVHIPGTGPGADLAVLRERDELIAYGPLLSGNGTTWLGTAVLARAPDPGTARAVLTPTSK